MNFFDFVIASAERRQLKSFSVSFKRDIVGERPARPRERKAMSLRGM